MFQIRYVLCVDGHVVLEKATATALLVPKEEVRVCVHQGVERQGAWLCVLRQTEKGTERSRPESDASSAGGEACCRANKILVAARLTWPTHVTALPTKHPASVGESSPHPDVSAHVRLVSAGATVAIDGDTSSCLPSKLCKAAGGGRCGLFHDTQSKRPFKTSTPSNAKSAVMLVRYPESRPRNAKSQQQQPPHVHEEVANIAVSPH